MILDHDGYLAEVTYTDGDDLMHGVTTNTRAILHFAGSSVKELKKAFADTVEDYVAFCREKGVEPEKPYSGKLMLRISPDLHRRLAIEALRINESLNKLIEKRLEASPSKEATSTSVKRVARNKWAQVYSAAKGTKTPAGAKGKVIVKRTKSTRAPSRRGTGSRSSVSA